MFIHESWHTSEHHIQWASLLSWETPGCRQKSKAICPGPAQRSPPLPQWGEPSPDSTDQALFPAAASLDPQAGAIVSSYASSGQGMCTAGLEQGLWTETVCVKVKGSRLEGASETTCL